MADVTVIRRRLRAAYESGRRRRALWLAWPFALVGLLGAISGTPLPAALVAVAVCGLAWGSFVVGRSLESAVFPGTVFGLIPFGLAQATRLYGHACVHGHCTTLCMPACIAGGLVAGVAVTLVGLRHRAAPTYFLAAGVFSALTGGLGCTCVGSTGVVAMVAGLVVSLGFGTLSNWARSRHAS